MKPTPLWLVFLRLGVMLFVLGFGWTITDRDQETFIRLSFAFLGMVAYAAIDYFQPWYEDEE